MEKVYRLLPWLDITQAIDHLENLTNTPFTPSLLLQLCDAGECAAYLDCMNVEGESLINNDSSEPIFGPVVGRGNCQVTNPSVLLKAGFRTTVIGPAWLAFEDVVKNDCEWLIINGTSQMSPIFKTSDIHILAAKLNDTADYAVEVKDLHQQLKTAECALEAAEAELSKRRSSDARNVLDTMRKLTQRDSNFLALEHRAEEAERLVANLEKQVTELRAQKQPSENISAEQIRKLKQLYAPTPICHTPPLPDGLTFPYETKELEAMRTAVAMHWEDYTPEKRQPTQKAVALTLGQLLGLPRQSNGDPARKAIILASAIRPPTLADE
jgi:hypothetical protein